jgi:hypothetical protein
MGRNQQRGEADEDAEEVIDDASAEGAQDELDSSLTSDKEETDDPRSRFMEQFATDGDEQASEDPEEDDGQDEDDGQEPEDQEEDDGQEPESEEGEEPDSDEVDIGVDLSGIEGLEEEEELPDEFDPTASLPSKLWKSLPQDAKTHIARSRSFIKRQKKQLQALEPQAKWTTTVLQSAEKAGVTNDELVGWLDLGFRAQQGDPKAIQTLGNMAQQGGYTPEVEPDTSELQAYLKDEVEEFNLTQDQAKAILARVKPKAKEKRAESAPRPQPPAPPQTGHQAPRTTQDHLQQVQQAAIGKIAEADKRFAAKFGKKWPEMRERVRKEVILEQASSPLPPAEWPKVWLAKAKAEAAKTVKRQKSRSKMRGKSESLGRGAPVTSQTSSKSDNPREEFHRQFSS